MRCWYEVLGVERTAETEVIRKAYRSAALRTHPDKGGSDALFREVQSAWEVLGDPKERSFYDSHRDALLREPVDGGGAQSGGGGAGGGGGTGGGGYPPADEFDLFPFFRPSCFSGYGSGPSTFYEVYSRVFSALAQQEAAAAASAGCEFEAPPLFGGAATPYAPSLAAFYSFWLSFSTLKQYEWVDAHDPSQADSRKVRRIRIFPLNFFIFHTFSQS